jgi:hypothetical protein
MMPVLAGALLTAMSIGPALLAQGEGEIEAKVPFAFVAADHTFPAGEYTFTITAPGDASTVAIQSKDGHINEALMTQADDSIRVANKAQLVFERYDGKNFLSQIWIPGYDEGRRIPQSEVQQELAKTARKHETVTIAASKR